MQSLFKVFMSKEAGDAVSTVLQSGYVAQGEKVECFEKKLSEYFSHPYILTLNSATSGLTLALRLLNLESGDEVISTPLTCTATNWPILANGLKIKWADVDTTTCNISISSIREKLSEKTKAIMVMHWGGYPVDLDALKLVQDEAEKRFGFRPPIIEDCAHAFGATFKNKLIGTTGNISVFSLQAIKHLTSGDGGLIFLPTKELYERAKRLRWFGIDREARSGNGDFRLEADIPEWGYKFHMNDINASIGLANLPYVSNNLTLLREIGMQYRQRLSKLHPIVRLLDENPDFNSARWIFTIKIVNKPEFIAFMKAKNIMTSQVHNRNDKHTCVNESITSLPHLDQLETEIVCIPAGWWLTEDEKEYILASIEEYARNSIN
jgi:dTDP-4-amino-4,6-dideoxygalactose transaminase